jgi:RNA polymerase sigma-70 factor (ECF subfamily)
VSEQSLESLVRVCQRTLPEDHRAFEQLMRLTKARVFATALRLMGTREDAEDQTQEVFLRVYDRIKDVDNPATFPAWLSRITVNTCLNTLKRQRRLRTESLLDDTEEDRPTFPPDGTVQMPDEQVMAQELRACIEQVLTQMADRERAILVLRDLEAFSYQEISDLLHISLSAVKVRIHRTRLAFQQLFNRLCRGLWGATTLEDR